MEGRGNAERVHAAVIRAVAAVKRQLARQQALRVFPDLLEQLCALLDAGIPLMEALRHMLAGEKQRTTRGWLQRAADAVEMGESLSSAWMSDVPALLFLLLQTGEQTGHLADSCKLWCQHVRERQAWRRHIIQSVSYPALLGVLTCGLLVFISQVLLPAFASLYRQMGYHPPGVIRFLRTALAVTPELAGFTTGALGGLLILSWKSSDSATKVVRTVRRYTPGYRLRQLSRTLTLSMLLQRLLSAGIPMVQALAALGRQADSKWLRNACQLALGRILAGMPLAHAFPGDWDPLFPVLLAQAEQTGDLAHAVRRMEEYSRLALQRRVQKMVKVAEPVLLLILGSLVAVTMFSVFMPMYQLISTIGTGHTG